MKRQRTGYEESNKNTKESTKTKKQTVISASSWSISLPVCQFLDETKCSRFVDFWGTFALFGGGGVLIAAVHENDKAYR